MGLPRMVKVAPLLTTNVRLSDPREVEKSVVEDAGAASARPGREARTRRASRFTLDSVRSLYAGTTWIAETIGLSAAPLLNVTVN
jgi:hypothetical protein